MFISSPRRLGNSWPWAVLALTLVPAIWHYVDFPEDLDREYPKVIRPTFSPRPPGAYRLAEAGDTIDHVALYAGSVAIVLCATGLALSRARRLPAGFWATGLALSLAATWHASTPGPMYDDWPSLGWRSLFDPEAAPGWRLALGAIGIGLVTLALVPIGRERRRLGSWLVAARTKGVAGLLIVALILTILGQFRIPGVEPADYWPRWSFALGLIAFDLALVRVLPPMGFRLPGLGLRLAGGAAVASLIVGGFATLWYQRPLERLKMIEPGRLYISAMPTPGGLAEVHRRHHFKTIINLFAEEIDEHPLYPAERQFAAEHDIRYLNSPGDPAAADDFLDETLRVACDPDAWPILVHCHGCMDRTPAWLGIYRFVKQGRPLAEIMAEIEQHRGYRPKASVTLLYNWNLPRLAPERYAQDPTARTLLESAHGRSLRPAETPRVARRP